MTQIEKIKQDYGLANKTIFQFEFKKEDEIVLAPELYYIDNNTLMLLETTPVVANQKLLSFVESGKAGIHTDVGYKISYNDTLNLQFQLSYVFKPTILQIGSVELEDALEGINIIMDLDVSELLMDFFLEIITRDFACNDDMFRKLTLHLLRDLILYCYEGEEVEILYDTKIIVAKIQENIRIVFQQTDDDLLLGIITDNKEPVRFYDMTWRKVIGILNSIYNHQGCDA